ncbi:MAG: DUF4180 domain-containing protein [Clostridia bacterium]|nr:DUF4180 domain-containing protein [Clostridia bacterium]
MNITIEGINKNIAYVQSESLIITNPQSALDLMATVKYEAGCSRIIIDKTAIVEDFFKLSTRLAGEILQKYTNYNIKLAIVGGYSVYTSKPLKDFIYESNNGKDFFFVSTVSEAVERLSRV